MGCHLSKNERKVYMATTGSKVRKTTSATPARAKTTTSRNTEDPVPEKREYTVVKHDLDPSMYVTVKNGFNGTLVYKSKRTGERFVWKEFGDEQDIELMELKSARNSSKAFFENNWFLFDDPDVVEWLGVGKFYKYALNSANFDKIFTKTPEEIKKTVAGLSNGQKKTMVFRAKQLIADGKIDSIRVITALEESLSVELIERHS